MSPSKKSTKKSRKPINPNTVAAKARAQLAVLEKGLSLQAAFTAEEKKRVNPLLRIPPEAMNIAADLVLRQPSVFGSIDATAMTNAAAYELAMTPLEQQAAQLAARIHESIIAAKAPAAAQTLDVYAVAKPLTRLKQGESMLPQIAKLKSLVKTTTKHRKPKDGAAATTAETSTKAATSTPETAPAATVDEVAATTNETKS